MQNDNITYINIMIDSLKKKEIVLENLKSETVRQSEILDKEEFDDEAFDRTIDSKQKYLDELEKLDEGFMDMYTRVKEALQTDGSRYASEIEQAKILIKKQTDLSVELQTLEEKNRTKLAIHLSRGKQKVRDFRTSSKTAAAYYKNLANRHQEGDSYFFNREK
ncbi:MAG: hypothetical protein K6G24_03670 [Lachnospiraceae bacterium]|nr:hypothetical protein [Lachnospiraceae bacterium]